VTPPTPPTPPVDPPVTPPTVPDVPGEQVMYVVVNNNVSKLGLNLRKLPNSTSAILGVEPIGTKMRVLDNPDEARQRIGLAGQWILVKDDKGRRGYVGAAYVAERK
jgi:hypothetical protein